MKIAIIKHSSSNSNNNTFSSIINMRSMRCRSKTMMAILLVTKPGDSIKSREDGRIPISSSNIINLNHHSKTCVKWMNEVAVPAAEGTAQ